MSGENIGSVNAALLQMAAKIGGLESTVSTPERICIKRSTRCALR